MYNIDVDEQLPDHCNVTAWQPAVTGITEVFHAHIVDWAYPLHSHDTWTVLIVDHGAIDYSLDKKPCAALQQSVAILAPGVIHDGQPASRSRDGFWKRSLYLDAETLPVEMIGPSVDMATIIDPQLRSAISGLHQVLSIANEPIDTDARLAMVCDRIQMHLDPRTIVPHTETGVAHKLRELLDEHIAGLSLPDAAAVLDRTVPHLVRSFTASMGISPHAYVIGRRIAAARPMLLQGVPAAEVATAVGFYDQAHFTRHFKRHTSTTPARYAKSRARV